MDEVEFYTDVEKWCTENYPKYNKSVVSMIYNVSSKLCVKLGKERWCDYIETIKLGININSIETGFYQIYTDFRKEKSDSYVLTSSSINRKALGILGLDKCRLKIPPKIKTQNSEEQNDNQEQVTEKIEKIENEEIMPVVLRKLGPKNKVVMFINDRFKSAKKTINCKSKQSQKIMTRYWVHILEQFGPLETLDMNLVDLSIENVVEKVSSIITNTYYIIYLHHLFVGISPEWNVKTKQLKPYFDIEDDSSDSEDGDKDTLSAKQQEDIWKACETTLEKLVISFLFTTGMRVGGLTHIKVANIYDRNSNSIKDYGTTLEKGNKTRKFPIFEMTKGPLKDWINENHMIESTYLFPNSRDLSKPRSTMSFQLLFKKIAKRAGYEGPEIHIHAARHSVAHNLLEAGNNMTDIGKYLGHANPATTAKFYAKLSTQETVERMNTACIGGTNRKDKRIPQIPSFTDNNKNKNEVPAKKRRSRGLGKLGDVNIGGRSVNEETLLRALETARANKI